MKSEKHLPGTIANPMRFSNYPYIINIKNLTDEKLYDIKMFDFQYEKQKKIKYSSLMASLLYSDMLNMFIAENTPQTTIKVIRIMCFCDYKKFELKQTQAVIRECYTKIDGNATEYPIEFVLDPYQSQSNILIRSDLNIKYFNQLQLKIEYLMPETEITFYLYPENK